MKSIFYRRIGLAFLLGVTLMSMAGCSGSGATRPRQTPPAPEAAQLLNDVQFAAAVANAMDRIVARDRRFDVRPDDGFSVSGTSGILLPGSDPASGSGEVVTSLSSARGGHVTSSVPWRGEQGLEFYVEISPYDQEDDGILSTRYVDTSYQSGAFEGFATAAEAIPNHGLEAGWQGLMATNVYERGGTLTVRMYTDVEDDDNLDRPWANDAFLRQEARHDIALHELSPLPAGHDWRSIPIPVQGLAGSLDGIEGRFSCPAGGECSLDNERLMPNWEGYHPGYDSSNSVLFTPADGGSPVQLSGSDSRPVPEGNYLTFGDWLYSPPDTADIKAFQVGVFASGRDPFRATDLAALAGTATYTGEAAGLYATAAPPATGTFSADVELLADFGTGSDFGNASGWVTGFVLDYRERSPLPELRLLPAAILGSDELSESGSTEATLLPGGWVHGGTAAVGGWRGEWGGRFFGNGAGEYPSSFAGTFGATDGNHRFAGGFGVHAAGR
ncbi:MAG: hypothetical protein OXP66_17380 [Candidatus Tectomicrobia bacterium]|nr:hypothetical protein [Candidatus Tectomicrobia bacterium]